PVSVPVIGHLEPGEEDRQQTKDRDDVQITTQDQPGGNRRLVNGPRTGPPVQVLYDFIADGLRRQRDLEAALLSVVAVEYRHLFVRFLERARAAHLLELNARNARQRN